MAYEVRVPDLGDEAEGEATVSFWKVEEGERVRKEDDLVELTTDKGAYTVPAPVAGTVEHIAAAEGDTVTVGHLLATIEPE